MSMSNEKETLEEDVLEAFEQALEAGENIEDIEVLDDSGSQALKEMENRYQRSLAEFDNYRKRTTKEMAARFDEGAAYAVEKLIPMIDNFERALNAQENKEDSFYKGVEMIARQFEGILADLGVQPIEVNVGDQFSTDFHNAVAHVEDENFGANEVVQVLQTGYVHKGKVLRYSMVQVAN